MLLGFFFFFFTAAIVKGLFFYFVQNMDQLRYKAGIYLCYLASPALDLLIKPQTCDGQVSWCFEPSQPLIVIPGLTENGAKTAGAHK